MNNSTEQTDTENTAPEGIASEINAGEPSATKPKNAKDSIVNKHAETDNTLKTDFDLSVNYAYGEPTEHLDFRRAPEDFIVEELSDIAFSGEGEHFWLKIRKIGENTQWIADKLAQYFSIAASDVGYAGMKDRHAVTTQWFSLYLPGKPHVIDWDAFLASSDVHAELLESHTHAQKLRRGQHDGNRFVLRLHGVTNQSELESRLQKIAADGVPNYFGEQRFGRDGNNLVMAINSFVAQRPIRNKHKKGLAMSAARSYLFNLVLSHRVAEGTWHTLLDGDQSDNLPTGPLWGRGRPLCSGETSMVEVLALAEYSQWCNQLEHCGLNQDRRLLVLKPENMAWEFQGDSLRMALDLSGGEFATAVLRELAVLNNCSHVQTDTAVQTNS